MKFKKYYEYDDEMDTEVMGLCDAMNALPGIKTTESCCGHSSSPFSIWFNVYSEQGLFFLGRCASHRYWKYGYLWKIEIQVGDSYNGCLLPIAYHLSSGPIVGEDAYVQANDLVRNMIHHVQHKVFMSGFDLDIKNFHVEE